MNVTPLILDVTEAAQADIAEIGFYYAMINQDIRDRFYRAVDKTFRTLASAPTLGERCRFRNPAAKGIRVWQVDGFSNYLIFYRPKGEQLEIVRVLHGARDYETMFNETSQSRNL